MPTATVQPNDDGIFMRYDGDVLVDHKIREEMGFVLSDRNEWAFPRPSRPVGVFRLRDANHPPIKDREAMLFSEDPSSVSQQAGVYEGLCPEVTRRAARQKWSPLTSLRDKLLNLKAGVVIGTTLILAVVVAVSLAGEPSAQHISSEPLISERSGEFREANTTAVPPTVDLSNVPAQPDFTGPVPITEDEE